MLSSSQASLLTVAIHARHVPERVTSFRAMLDKGLQVDYVEDRPGKTWEWSFGAWVEGLELAYKEGASHILFVQDDLVIDEDFQKDVLRRVNERPGDVIALSAHHWKFAEAWLNGASWASSYDGIIGNAYVFPMQSLRRFLDWTERCITEDTRHLERGEDTLIALWGLHSGTRFLHPLPGLWGHNTSAPSLFANDETEYRQPVVIKGEYKEHEGDVVDVGFTFRFVFWWLCTHMKPEYRQVEKAYAMSRLLVEPLPPPTHPHYEIILDMVQNAGPKKHRQREFRFDSDHSWDVVIYDTVGSYNPPHGGSEIQLVTLKHALESAGYKVLLTNQDNPSSCKTLVISRYSPKPLHIRSKHAVTYAQDKESYPYPTRVIWVSEWQRGNRSGWIIPPFLEPVEPPTLRVPGQWIFPCSPVKGLESTIWSWEKKHQENPEKYDTLVLANTYQDTPSAEKHGIVGFEKVTPELLRTLIAESSGLFIRNTYEECFPITVQIAAQQGLEFDVSCVGHNACGIREASEPRDLSVAKLLPLWINALKLR
jgi:hypothetical protein